MNAVGRVVLPIAWSTEVFINLLVATARTRHGWSRAVAATVLVSISAACAAPQTATPSPPGLVEVTEIAPGTLIESLPATIGPVLLKYDEGRWDEVMAGPPDAILAAIDAAGAGADDLHVAVAFTPDGRSMVAAYEHPGVDGRTLADAAARQWGFLDEVRWVDSVGERSAMRAGPAASARWADVYFLPFTDGVVMMVPDTRAFAEAYVAALPH